MPQSTRKSQADEDDAELSEAQTADGQMSNSEGEQGSEHAEPPAEANAQSDTKKKGRASKSAIGKTAKKPAKQSSTLTRVAGKRTIVVPDMYNPEKLSEKHAEAQQLAKKGKRVQAKKRVSKS
jgi:hypothetical protein